ncbi:tRNA (N6-threonylcarbamoyladenosine(37)-N6)-methyltransferase TrmO [Rariglobus hedericola]|uniref:tRNA (N6-threonylcarbamoyladenosine(37)-N6)-methyltransferase TrmO n=1 Tax=Rariglobus hedericola TaxID=2597822 RepID=A0A556QNS2_9BACT|nr:tRNA (N6-threonylcarbamoyladenosine(37)-N6)-methyltransferase TrmO [Rariglobus hedericola]TSJ78291.1 tRNA (N6-threonylcarbamoyladenosine(37)-N6)-methyltransferase TrmO [Rariglobus hedericola]
MSALLSLRPVATLRTPFAEKFGVPRQSGFIPEAEGRVEFLPEFSAPDFVRGLTAFSHIWLVTGFHQNPPWTGAATVRPPRLGGNERVGVFASRAPNRPNGLGLSLVRLLAIEDGVLRVAGIDAVEGTPVYDIKPYLPWCEARTEATSDWSQSTPFAREETAVQLTPEIAALLGETTVRLVRQVLRLDLQPAYQDEPERIYGMALAGWNISWRALPDNAVEVISVTRLPS